MLPINTRARNPRRSLVSSPMSVPVSAYSPWSPLALQPKLWLDASDLTTITESSGAVSEWRDKSGNGYAFTQATSTSQPTTGSTTQNGLNVLSFDGTNRFLTSTALSSEWKFLHNNTGYLLGVVFQRAVDNVFSVFFGTMTVGGGGSEQIGMRLTLNVANALLLILRNAASLAVVNTNTAAGTSTNARIVSYQINPSAPAAARAIQQIGGAALTLPNGAGNAASDSDPLGTLTIGSRPGVADSLNGFIAELVVVTGSGVTNANRQLIHNYLNAKWAVY